LEAVQIVVYCPISLVVGSSFQSVDCICFHVCREAGIVVQECAVVVIFSVEVQEAEELGACLSYWRSRGQRHRRGWYRWGRCVWYSWKREVCKGIALSLPLNCKATLWSSLSLFKYY